MYIYQKIRKRRSVFKVGKGAASLGHKIYKNLGPGSVARGIGLSGHDFMFMAHPKFINPTEQFCEDVKESGAQMKEALAYPVRKYRKWMKAHMGRDAAFDAPSESLGVLGWPSTDST